MIDDRSRVPTLLSVLRWPVALGALALTLLTLAGPSSSADPVTITMARNADMLTFDPASTEDDPSIFVELQIFDRLVKLNAANNGVEPELATSWTVAPDGLSATFTLRQGIKYSDGSPLTAEDVVFSLTRAIDQKGSWGFLFSPVKSVTKVDDKTIKLTMSEPFAPLLPALSTFAASIYSKANFEKWGKDAAQHPLGTGAYSLESWQKGAQMALVKNPVGFNEVLRMLTMATDGLSVPTMIVINDRHADGRDVSWLWDVDFELLADGEAPLTTAGIRGTDMANRLKYAGVSDDRIRSLEPDPGAAIDLFVANIPEGGRGYILATYTAMLDLRANLAERGAVERFWEQ